MYIYLHIYVLIQLRLSSFLLALCLQWFQPKTQTSCYSASRSAETASVMKSTITELVYQSPSDAAIPKRSFVEQKTYEPAPLSGQVDVFFHYEKDAWVAVNMTTYEIQPLPAPDLAWAVAIDDEAATLVEVARYKHAGKLIYAFDHFSLQLWKRSPDDVLVVRDSGQKEQPVVELSDFLSKRREATLHVRSRTGDGHQNRHKFTVILFDALCGGSSAYWSIKQILRSLSIKNPSCYLRQTQKSYEQARLQYELNDLETTGRGDAAMLETKAVCTEMFILLLARWSFRYKKKVA